MQQSGFHNMIRLTRLGFEAEFPPLDIRAACLLVSVYTEIDVE
jgi:hypothetical protein